MVNFRGGTSGNFSAFTDYDNVYVYDTISWPTGNRNLAGSRVVHIDSISVAGDSGVVNETVSSDGYVRLYSGTGRMTFERNSAVGGTIRQSNGAASWAGGLCGSFTWSTVPTAPVLITCNRTARDVEVVVTTPSASSGGSSITGYRAQYSTDGGTTWSTAQVMVNTGGYRFTFVGLDPATTYKFRAYAVNARGSSAASPVVDVFVPASAKIKKAGVFVDAIIGKRRVSGAFRDLRFVKQPEVIGSPGTDWSEDWSAGWDSRWTDGDVTPQTITNGWEVGTTSLDGGVTTFPILLNDYDAQADEIKPERAMTNGLYVFSFHAWYNDNNDAADFSTLEWLDNTDAVVLTMKQIGLTTIINDTTYPFSKLQPLYPFVVNFISTTEAHIYNVDEVTGAATSEVIIVKLTGAGTTGVLRLTKSNTGDDFNVILGAIDATARDISWEAPGS